MDPYLYRLSSAFNSPFWTTNSGAPVYDNNSSLTVGIRGSSCLSTPYTRKSKSPSRAAVYYSDDKLLQTRIFSYADTQRHRLGTNYLQLPANAPKCSHHNNHHEGFMNFMHREEEFEFLQPGERYRSWVPDRQERFIGRWVAALSDPRVTYEIKSIWISYWSQADKSLGQKLASCLNIRPSI